MILPAARLVLGRHRRLLAGLFAAAAVALGLAAVRPSAPGVPVLVAARDLAAGATLTSADLTVRALPAGAMPDGAVSRAAGRTLSGPVRRGEPLTDVRLTGVRLGGGAPIGSPVSGASLADGGEPGTVATPVRIADAAVALLLHAGDRVDVLAARADGPAPARLVATAVPIIAVPRPGPDATEGALLVLRTARDQAMALARAAVDSRLSVTVVG